MAVALKGTVNPEIFEAVQRALQEDGFLQVSYSNQY
jgi:hypothetical protein